MTPRKLKDIETTAKKITAIIASIGAVEALNPPALLPTQPLVRTRPRRREQPPAIIPQRVEAILPAVTVPKLSKKERVAAYNKKKADKEALQILIQHASMRDQRLDAIASGQETFPLRERHTFTEPALSVFLKKNLPEIDQQLHQLKTIVAEIKASNTWSEQQQYAILQSFAYLNELIAKKHWDNEICKVARNIRNAIFKNHQQVLAVGDTKENLLNIVNPWMAFLETDTPAYFPDDQAIFRIVHSEHLAAVYTLGLYLPNQPDVATCKSNMTLMLRFRDNHGTEETGLINDQALKFCWAILDSNLKALKTSRQRAAKKAAHEFAGLEPFVNELRDRGILARHPEEERKFQPEEKKQSWEETKRAYAASKAARFFPTDATMIKHPHKQATSVWLWINSIKAAHKARDLKFFTDTYKLSHHSGSSFLKKSQANY